MAEAHDHPDLQPPSPDPVSEAPRVVDAQELFLGSREIRIEHAGVHYRLRITRRNRLILQK